MIFRRRWMADDFKPIVQTAIMLAVVKIPFPVSNGKNLLRVASDFAALVDLQLYAEVSWPVSVENRFRAVIVVVNDLIFQNMIAVFAIGIVLAVSQIIRILAVDQFPTAFTVCVMAVIASLAERMRPRTGIGVIPKPLPTVRSDNGFSVKAVLAEVISRKQCQRILRKFSSADAASMVVSHSRFPPDKKITAGRICVRRLHSDNMWLKSAIFTQFSGEIKEHHGKKQRRSFYHERL